ncbi:hypothetical protein CSUB01_04967 [Colletotrichum sublineola]|uniref:Tat pathway signal sequence n=1 Tax=Colletotrichum sublineola TaxID=1173701 RepID=A0A066WVE1_COLSU|nr:hypothetical protein CSUB01_04967 [Colletotrichum sublineola]
MKSRIAATSASVVLAAGAAVAQDAWRAPGSTFGSPLPPYIDNQTAPAFRNAVAAPNKTHSVKFRPFEDSGASNVQLTQDEWTWRVNVTELALPPLPSNLSTAGIDKPSTFVTTYDLTWPAGGNISSAMRGSSAPFCVTAFDYLFPANVTDQYTTADSGSADCERIFGEDCMNALFYEGNNLQGDQCVVPQWGDIPACNATLGAATRADRAGRPFFTLGAATADANPASPNNALNDAVPVQSGEGIWTFQGGVLGAADAASGYADAAGRLQVFMFNTWLNITNGRVSKPNILCMRVDTAADPADPAAPVGKSAAAGPRGRAAAVVMAIFVTIVASLV